MRASPHTSKQSRLVETDEDFAAAAVHRLERWQQMRLRRTLPRLVPETRDDKPRSFNERAAARELHPPRSLLDHFGGRAADAKVALDDGAKVEK